MGWGILSTIFGKWHLLPRMGPICHTGSWSVQISMNVLRAPHAVVPTQSARTCWGGTSVAVSPASPLPLETGSWETQATSPAQVSPWGPPTWPWEGVYHWGAHVRPWTPTAALWFTAVPCALQTSTSASPAGSALSTPPAPTLWAATRAAAKLDSSPEAPPVKVPRAWAPWLACLIQQGLLTGSTRGWHHDPRHRDGALGLRGEVIFSGCIALRGTARV